MSWNAHAHTELTKRDIEVLQAVAEGGTNAVIGKQLFMAETTVKSHIGRIRDRFDIAPGTYSRNCLRAVLVVEGFKRGYIR